MTYSLLFYCLLKRFYGETKDTKYDKEFLKAFNYITEEEWKKKELEALFDSVTKYSMFEAQMSCIMDPWIQYMHAQEISWATAQKQFSGLDIPQAP